MTQEEKQLLLRDLCARLPYGVKINFPSPLNEQDVVEKLRDVELRGENILLSTTTWNNVKINECKPYLRPMSSMTEIEKQIFKSLKEDIDEDYCEIVQLPLIDWLNAHHFDYRGLIHMGLALEVPKDMYNS